jgi:hypothetical protein
MLDGSAPLLVPRRTEDQPQHLLVGVGDTWRRQTGRQTPRPGTFTASTADPQSPSSPSSTKVDLILLHVSVPGVRE